MGNCIRYKTEKRERGTLTPKNPTSSNDETEEECSWCIAYDKTGKMGSGVCTCQNTVGSCSCPPGAAPSASCVFYSPRIQALQDGERSVEQTTQDHWTSVDLEREANGKRVGEDNRKYFDEVLVKHPDWSRFFTKFEDLKVGAKIGEGGQAEIFEATSMGYGGKLVAKVWKEGVSLIDLERQWPPQMLSQVAQGVFQFPFMNIYGGAFIKDGEFKNRFAFVMRRQWGDLRRHIDHQMLKLHNNNTHGPPFRKMKQVSEIINEVLVDLRALHDVGIVHRDIKASNVLLDDLSSKSISYVMDFECSIGITGTGFWRAPEILEQLQNGVPSNEVVFSDKADIYSFGMLCYEIITGCIPFESHPQNDYSIVLRGGRPKLPNDLNPRLRKLILDCWEHDPNTRPSFANLVP